MDPTDHDKRDLGNGASGGRLSRHANGGVPRDDSWLRPILENSSEVVKLVDTDGTLRYASPAFGRVFGYDPREAVGTMNVLDHVHPDDLPRVLAESEKALAQGKATSNRAEYRFRHKDGSWRWVESVANYLSDDPQVGGVLVNVRDVTERKEAEEALRRSEDALKESERRFDSVIFNAHAYAYRCLNEPGWPNEYASGYALELTGYPPEDLLIGEKVRLGDLIVEEDRQRVWDEVQRALEEGRGFELRYAIRRRDGQIRHVHEYGQGIYAEDGDVIALEGLLYDVTERKEAEERYRTLIEQIPAVTYVEEVGEAHSTLYMSPQVENLLGYPQEDWLGGVDHWKRCLHPEDRERVLAENASSDETGEPFRVEYRMVHRDGRTIWVHDEAVLVEDPVGRSGFWQGVLTDVTERAQAEDRLREAEERYRTLVERVPAIVYVQEAEDPSRTTYVSPQNEAILGYSPEECLADPEHWIKILHPEDRERVLAEDARSNEKGESFAMEYRQFAKDGRTVWIRDEATLVRDEAGEPLYWLGVQADVTERRLTEARLREAETRYRSLVERVPVAIYRQEIDHSGAVSYISPQIEAITGYAPEEYADPNLWVRTMHPDDRHRVLDEDERTDRTGEPFRVEFRKVTKDGRLIWLRDEAVLVRDEAGEPLYWQGFVQDVTERKTLEERLERQALHDSLTGLPNRALFVDRLGQALRRTRRRKGRRVAVLFMDLDGFKNVNDSLGHDVGDLLLVMVAQRLRRCLRPEDALARFGGDEFVVLVEDVDELAQAVQVAERITEELRWPFVVEGRELYVKASIGVSLGDARTHNPEGLIREADTAMYQSKEAGGGFRVFDPAMHERVVGRLEIENDLRRAVERGEFVVHYQPIVNLQTGELRGMEALMRWEHPERGLLDPGEFVPIAEESGLVVPMGEQVLREACARAKEWQRDHPQMPPLVVSVNLSARQLKRPDIADVVEGTLRGTGLEARSLSLDVTETVYVGVLEGNTGALGRLREMGVGISIDDFGTGYSSLAYLKRLPADALKIDKSFVDGLGEDAEDTAIVGMIVELAHTLGMEVVGEGVETEEQAELLREMGCDFGQGYHFSKPMPPEKLPGFLAS